VLILSEKKLGKVRWAGKHKAREERVLSLLYDSSHAASIATSLQGQGDGRKAEEDLHVDPSLSSCPFAPAS